MLAGPGEVGGHRRPEPLVLVKLAGVPPAAVAELLVPRLPVQGRRIKLSSYFCAVSTIFNKNYSRL